MSILAIVPSFIFTNNYTELKQRLNQNIDEDICKYIKIKNNRVVVLGPYYGDISLFPFLQIRRSIRLAKKRAAKIVAQTAAIKVQRWFRLRRQRRKLAKLYRIALWIFKMPLNPLPP